MGNWKTQMEYVVGVDFGSDSVRAVIVRASDGQVAAEAAIPASDSSASTRRTISRRSAPA